MMADKPLWIWEPDLKRYRDTKTGRFIGIDQMNELRPVFLDQRKAEMTNLVTSYKDGKIDIFTLESKIKANLKQTYIDMYVMGKGGRNNMTPADWGSIGGMLKEQYRYLEGMMKQIASGELSPAQVASRLKMYENSSNEALWRGYLSDLPLDLPAYPGDGSTVCLTNCQCEWEIVEIEGGYDCYWQLGASEHCPDCIERAERWNPYRIRISGGE